VNRGAFLRSACAVTLATQAVASAADSLSAKIRAIARALSGEIGVYARTMASGPPLVSYAALESFPTASTIKVLIMTTAYAAEQSDPGALSEKISFYRSELIGGSDFMSEVDDGRRFTVRQLLTPMIQVSDNTAANMLIGHFGVQAINLVGERAGMARTHLARKFLDYGAVVHHHDNVSTASDMGRLLYLIERGARERVSTIVSPEGCRAMIGIMLGQTDRDGIPAALPSNAQVANKTGEIVGTRNDIAIVEPFGDSPFVLAIMTRDAFDYRAAYAAIHAVTRATYAAAAGTFA
jgi:beta-lactamase class A